ncbi:hypothetical protein Tco_0003869 [Tanacetum coccineum]
MVTEEIVPENEPVKEPEVETVKKEPVEEPHLTDTILEVLVPQPEIPQATPKPDRGNDKVTNADESPLKLMYMLTEEQIQAHLDKEENLEKAAREARINTITINRGLIQAILTSLPPQPIREAKKASNLRRIPPGV